MTRENGSYVNWYRRAVVGVVVKWLLVLAVVALLLPGQAKGSLVHGAQAPRSTPFLHDYDCYDTGEWLSCYMRRACYKLPVTARSTMARTHKRWVCRWQPGPYS